MDIKDVFQGVKDPTFTGVDTSIPFAKFFGDAPVTGWLMG